MGFVTRNMKQAEKSLLTKTLKKMYAYENESATWKNFSPKQQQMAKKLIDEKKAKKEKRKETWTKMQIIKYREKIGEPVKYNVRTLPKSMIQKYEKDNNFLKFKKFEGYRLLYRKLKGESAKTNQQIMDFINLLQKERLKPRKKKNSVSRVNAKYTPKTNQSKYLR
jgi:hypothetical protein